jgi:hypothetical protein
MIGNSWASGVMTFEEAEAEVARYRADLPLEKVDGDIILFKLAASNGFTWLYGKYGRTVRDRGIKDKMPYWYFLRSLLPTFDPSEQEEYFRLSGISVSDSIVPDQCKRKLMTNDAERLVSFHYDMACMGKDDKAMRMKKAWYELARANPNTACSFWTGRLVDEEYTHELAGMATFAQMMENAETPGEGGLHYLVPDIDPDCYFFSDDPVLLRKQASKYGCRIDP